MNKLILDVRFFASYQGSEPVREWLKSLSVLDRRTIGEDIKTVQYGWPLGRKMLKNLWEIRVHLVGRIARIFFTVENNMMVLLHGFIKKSQATPIEDLEIAKNRLKQLRGA
jgi:phage-related protein